MPGRGAHPALARALHSLDGPFCRRVVITESHQDLVQDDVVDDPDAVDGGKLGSEATGQGTAAVDELGDAAAAQLAQRGPRREPPCPADDSST